MTARLAVVSFILWCGASQAHDLWADGSIVPPWVKC